VTGVGGYRELIHEAIRMDVYGQRIKDLADLAEIEEIKKRRPS